MAFLCCARAQCYPHAGSKTARQSEDVHNRLFASPGEVPTSAIVRRTERERLGGGLTVIRDESVIAHVPGFVMGYQGVGTKTD